MDPFDYAENGEAGAHSVSVMTATRKSKYKLTQ